MIEGISYTEERAENMLFSGIPMGDERYCVYVKPDHTDISSSETASFNGKKDWSAYGLPAGNGIERVGKEI